MQELDVSKPMMFEQDEAQRETEKIEFIRTLTYEDGKKAHLFIATNKDGLEAAVITDRFGNGRFFSGLIIKIINIPEKQFSWDKPIRSKNPEFRYIKHEDNHCPNYPKRVLIEEKNGERNYLHCRENGSFGFACPLDVELENYEPEERYEIVDMSWNNGGWGRFIVEDKAKDNDPIAGFNKKEDAELFKKIKEQGL